VKIGAALLAALAIACHPPAASVEAPPRLLAVYRDSIPRTLIAFDLVRVPAGNGVGEFLIGRTELLWEAYDAFMLSPPDTADRGGAEAIARPSRPYGAPDYGWGHRGYPTISVAREAGEAFCAWLSAATGRRYRLPTEREWLHVAALAIGSTPLSRERLDSLAWHAGNSGGTTHAAATLRADALGLYDLFGNAGEWVVTADGSRVILGGSFRDPPHAVGPNARAVQDESWNERDPQIPRSRWWLSDGPFAGFRIVRELP
jgi:formylglycine-generating enzyme required for sulfatase activity